MDIKKIQHFINQTWDISILPALSRYIEIPCQSVMFDAQWEKHGYLDQAMSLISTWCHKEQVAGMTLKVHKLPGRTPLLMITIPGETEKTVLLYGHMDKQPEMEGWSPELGPWKPVIKDGKLYGRGGADDGYAVFSALKLLKKAEAQIYLFISNI